MKLEVLVHKAEDGGIGLKFRPYQDVQPREKPFKSFCKIFMKLLKVA
ncbi:MAG: hypothetical protein ABI472_06570 [Ginsengibacter sp.]